MVKVQFQKQHGCAALAFQRVITEGGEDGGAPVVKASVEVVLFTGYGTTQLFVYFPMAGVNAAIPDHFIMLFRDVLDEALHEFHNREGFLDVCVIFMTVVMEGNKVTIIFVDSGSGNDGTPKVTPDIFHDGFGITFVGPGIDVEALLVFAVTA